MKRNDIILLIAVILAALAAFGSYQLLHHENGDMVQISIDSEVTKTFSLNSDTTYTIKTKDGGSNILQIKDGYASIQEADCPDKLCVHQKKISKQGETLVCLPHKVVVSIISSQTPELDGVAQ